ncbi:MAG: hypothetical protein JO023_02855, partial [Chloroflexi bacterium]|nr:hypothetical protein [Chloroflexota bacterium]
LSLLFAPPAAGNPALLAGLPTGLFRSTDAGQSWESSNAGLSAQLVLGVVAAPTAGAHPTLYAVSPTEGIHRSPDGGATWEPASPPAGVLALAVSPTFDADGILLAATTNGLWRSADAGLSWSAATGDDAAVSGVRTVPGNAERPWGAVAVLASGQVLLSADRGSSWVTRSTPFAGAEVLALTVSPDRTLLVAVRQPPSVVVWRSIDNGSNWRRWLVEPSSDSPALAIAADGAVFVGLGAHLLRVAPSAWETRGGERRPVWRRTPLGDDVRITAVLASPGPRRERDLYLASSAGIFVSRHGGEHMEPWGLDDQPVVALTLADEDTLLAVTLGGSIWRRVLGR